MLAVRFYVRNKFSRRGEKLFSLLPWRQTDSVLDLSGADLIENGITFLMADLDNTLCRYKEHEPSEELRAWAENLRQNGVELFLLSNSRRPDRAKHFAEALGIQYLGHAGKPKRSGFLHTLERCAVRPENCAMVGDQIFTDVLGANRTGIRSILVRPIELAGNPGRYIRCGVELPMRWLAKGRKWKE